MPQTVSHRRLNLKGVKKEVILEVILGGQNRVLEVIFGGQIGGRPGGRGVSLIGR